MLVFLSILDEVFADGSHGSPFQLTHKRSHSTSTTVSEREFKQELNKYNSIRKCLVKRHDSQQEYQRFSARYYGSYLYVAASLFQHLRIYLFPSCLPCHSSIPSTFWLMSQVSIQLGLFVELLYGNI